MQRLVLFYVQDGRETHILRGLETNLKRNVLARNLNAFQHSIFVPSYSQTHW
jgi:hypothetical protein